VGVFFIDSDPATSPPPTQAASAQKHRDKISQMDPFPSINKGRPLIRALQIDSPEMDCGLSRLVVFLALISFYGAFLTTVVHSWCFEIGNGRSNTV
jgi:hypothetical protein